MAKVFTIHKAKTQFSKLIRLALRGEDIIIANGKEPLIRLVPVEGKEPQRTIGLFEGKISMSDDFDAPLDDFKEYQ